MSSVPDLDLERPRPLARSTMGPSSGMDPGIDTDDLGDDVDAFLVGDDLSLL